MEFGIKELADLTGVTPRTLRYYHQIGLLNPSRVNEAGYRFYGEEEVNRLQQILFYREMGMGLQEIQTIMDKSEEERLEVMKQHYQKLLKERSELDLLIENVSQTIEEREGVRQMSNWEKFKGLHQAVMRENAARYEIEIWDLYSIQEQEIRGGKIRLKTLSPDEYETWKQLEHQLQEGLELAVLRGDSPSGEQGKRLAFLHRKCLQYVWDKYSPSSHRRFAALCTDDIRFIRYYDSLVEGCARFLRAAIEAHI